MEADGRGRVLHEIANRQLRGLATSVDALSKLVPDGAIDKLLESLGPELVVRHGDSVLVTLEGLAQTEHWTDAKSFLDHALRFLRDELAGRGPIEGYSWKALVDGSKIRLADVDHGTALLYLGGLAAGRSGREPSDYTFVAPDQLGDIVGRADDAEALRGVVRISGIRPPTISSKPKLGKPEVVKRAQDGHTKLGSSKSTKRAAPKTAPTPLSPSGREVGVVNDGVGGEADDRLNVVGQADIFAQAIVSKEVHPPLAIGLFGEWGSGKSFFMKVLYDRIKKRAESGDDGSEEKKNVRYWSRITQIEFNAWHYMDADLWASMGSRIFEGLAEDLLGKDEGVERQKKRRMLREKLASTRNAKESAEAAHEAVVAELATAREKVGELKKERAKNFAAAPGFVAELKEIIKSEPELAEARKSLAGAAAKILGVKAKQVDALIAMPEQVDALAAEAKRLESTGRGLVTGLGSSWPLYVLVGLVAILPIAAAALGDWLSGSAAAVGEIGVVALGALAWLRKNAGEVEKVLGAVETIRERGAAIRERALANLTEEQQAAAKRALEADARVQVASRQVVELERSAAAIHDELEALSAAKLVYDFVVARGGEASSYRSREGIVSTVRRDLQTLETLLAEWREDAEALAKREAGNEAPASEEAGSEDTAKAKGQEKADSSGEVETAESVKEGPTVDPGERISDAVRRTLPIQRIVLYIDDLDRCPPRRVVEVLQAVHLLLAFDLFVVVVGVDPRWLERSLKKRFSDLIGDSDKTNGDDDHHREATARDYLEKIFQIPFALLPVDDDGFGKLVKEYLPTSDEVEQRRTQQGDSEASGGNTGTGSITLDPMTLEATGSVRDNPTGAARSFYLEPHERTFASALHELLPTPRLIKRFVNVYRLLRITVTDTDYTDFAHPGPAAVHRAVLVLLALNTGYPRFSSALLHRIETYTGTAKTFKDLFAELVADDVGLSEPQIEERDAARELVEALLARPETQVTTPVDDVITWAPKIGRYSMYWRSR